MAQNIVPITQNIKPLSSYPFILDKPFELNPKIITFNEIAAAIKNHQRMYCLEKNRMYFHCYVWMF